MEFMTNSGQSVRRFLFLAVALFIGIAAPARATTMLPMDLDDLVVEADGIVLGTIVDIESDWSINYTQNRSLLYTTYTLLVERGLRGVESGTVRFRVVGGDDGSTLLTVPGAPHFRQGDRVVLFLRAGIPDAISDVVGMEQGKFTVVDDMIVENGMHVDDFLTLISTKIRSER
jgi:hypothetical protein